MPPVILVLSLEVLLAFTIGRQCASGDNWLGVFISTCLGLIGPFGAVGGWLRGRSTATGGSARIRKAQLWGLVFGVVPLLVLLVWMVPLAAMSSLGIGR